VGKLFLKLYLILVITVSIFVFGIINLETLLRGPFERMFDYLAKGTLYLVDESLATIPQEKWPNFIEDLNKAGGYRLRLKNINEYELPNYLADRVNSETLILYTNDDVDFGYKRIPGSDLVLEFPFEQTEYRQTQDVSKSTFELLEYYLSAYPKELWNDRIVEANSHFGFPISLVMLDDLSISGQEKFDLLNGNIAVTDDDGKEIDYRRIKNTPYVIQLGPIEEPIAFDFIESMLLICFAIFIAVAVLFWVYPLSRELKYLEESAVAFGKGDFNARAIISKGSSLNKLTLSFNAMADRIQSLISSHKELTNAASHELRTPIARLRFGMEMMQNAKDTTERERYASGVNADIDELDNLVAEILTYARFDRDRPQMKFTRQHVATWLDDLIVQSKNSMESISLSYTIDNLSEEYASFEPRLMARAVGNLIQNARRYAKSKVEISVDVGKNRMTIHVDDDGQGIPESERHTVFDAFNRLDASRDRGTGGFGLGLAIAYRIAKWHHGSVSVVDASLGGARFTITWPT